MPPRIQKIEISHRTVIFTVFFLIGLYFVYLVRDIILLLLVSFLLMTAVNPLVTRLESYKVPRGLSAAVAFLLVFAAIIGAIAALVPPLINQLTTLLSQLSISPFLAAKVHTLTFDLQDLQVIANQLNSVPKVLNVIFSAFSAAIITITVGVMAFYLTVERRYLHKYLVWLFGNDGAERRAEQFINRIEEQIGSWVRGEFALMVVVGLMTYIGLSLLNINFALPLAILAGILEILPNIGPTISAIPTIIVAYITVSMPMALAVTALYILVQQLENNFIVPFIMKKIVGLNPIVTIVLLLTGFRLAGVIGATLSIPIFLIAKVAVAEFASSSSKTKVGAE